MATKDWRRTAKYDWIKGSFNSTIYDNIYIKKIPKFKRIKMHNAFRNDLFYFQSVPIKDLYPERKENYIVVFKGGDKEFKTLRQAKKFVKTYMRKH